MESFKLKRPAGSKRKKKILGRGPGSGLGKTSGRGQKGQKSRSGGGVRPGFEGGQMPLYRRIARRGFSNYPFKIETVVVNLDQIEAKYVDGETVSLETLKEKRLIKNRDKHVKILGRGELTKKLSFDMEKISASTKEKIEKTGGTLISKTAADKE